jgi:hypothetical protein
VRQNGKLDSYNVLSSVSVRGADGGIYRVTKDARPKIHAYPRLPTTFSEYILQLDNYKKMTPFLLVLICVKSRGSTWKIVFLNFYVFLWDKVTENL